MSSGDQAQVKALSSQLREMEVAAFEARRERERQQIKNFGEHAYLFSGGLGNALGNNLSLGAIPRRYLNDPAFLSGQRVGDGMSVFLGAAEFFVGQGIMGSGDLVLVASGGTLFPVAVPLSMGEAAVASHGVVVMGKALLEFSKAKEGQKHVGGNVQEIKSKFKTPKGNLSGKQSAKDIPDWAKGLRPKVGENGKDFAKRLMDEKYGLGNYTEGPKTEFNKIKKWADRAFE